MLASLCLLQMIDIKNRRHFLKKMRPPPDFREELLYLGSTVTLLSRQLKIIDYGDEFTRSKMQTRHEK
jgi:nucleoside-diphosphate kinase